MAYDSKESGQFEVYVAPYPSTQSAAPYQVSIGGGRQPLWSRPGDELYYRDFTGALFAVKTPPTSTFTASEPVRLLEGGAYAGAGAELSARMYDIGNDGRLLMVKNSADGALPMLVQVRHLFKHLTTNRVLSSRGPQTMSTTRELVLERVRAPIATTDVFRVDTPIASSTIRPSIPLPVHIARQESSRGGEGAPMHVHVLRRLVRAR